MSSQVNNKQKALIIGLIIIGIIIVGFFGMRAFHAFRKFSGLRPPPPGGAETNVDKIQDWMTIPFISKMYRVPDRMLFEAVGIPGHGNQNKSLKQLNDEYYPNASGMVMEKIKSAIQEQRPHPPPEPAITTPIP